MYMFLQVDVTDSRLYTTDMRSFEAALFVRRLYTHTKKNSACRVFTRFFFLMMEEDVVIALQEI